MEYPDQNVSEDIYKEGEWEVITVSDEPASLRAVACNGANDGTCPKHPTVKIEPDESLITTVEARAPKDDQKEYLQSIPGRQTQTWGEKLVEEAVEDLKEIRQETSTIYNNLGFKSIGGKYPVAMDDNTWITATWAEKVKALQDEVKRQVLDDPRMCNVEVDDDVTYCVAIWYMSLEVPASYLRRLYQIDVVGNCEPFARYCMLQMLVQDGRIILSEVRDD